MVTLCAMIFYKMFYKMFFNQEESMNRQYRPDAPHENGLTQQLSHQELLATQTTLLKPLGRDTILHNLRTGRFRIQKTTQGSTIHF